MLTRIYADNYRALSNFEFRPGSLSLLQGENGCGKTTMFDVLGSLRDLIVWGTPVSNLFQATRTSWDTRTLQRFELEFQEGTEALRYELEIQHEPANQLPHIRFEAAICNGESLFRASDGEVHLSYDDGSPGPTFPFRADRSYLGNLAFSPTNRTARLGRLLAQIYGIGIFQPNPFSLSLTSEREEDFLKRDGSNFASFFDHINSANPTARTEIESALSRALPGFKHFLFKRAGEHKLLSAKFNGSQNGNEFLVAQLSEGQRVLAVLYAAVLGCLHPGGLLCFDEPDNFVSLTEIQPWLQVLRDEIEKHGAQVIVISHHPEVIDYLALDAIWRFERLEGGPVLARALEPEDVSSLKLSELIVRGA